MGPGGGGVRGGREAEKEIPPILGSKVNSEGSLRVGGDNGNACILNLPCDHEFEACFLFCFIRRIIYQS